VKFFRALGC